MRQCLRPRALGGPRALREKKKEGERRGKKREKWRKKRREKKKEKRKEKGDEKEKKGEGKEEELVIQESHMVSGSRCPAWSDQLKKWSESRAAAPKGRCPVGHRGGFPDVLRRRIQELIGSIGAQ